MKAMKCDRCGKFYDEAKSFEFDGRLFDSFALTKSDDKGASNHFEDLCPECQTELHRWLTNKSGYVTFWPAKMHGFVYLVTESNIIIKLLVHGIQVYDGFVDDEGKPKIVGSVYVSAANPDDDKDKSAFCIPSQIDFKSFGKTVFNHYHGAQNLIESRRSVKKGEVDG